MTKNNIHFHLRLLALLTLVMFLGPVAAAEPAFDTTDLSGSLQEQLATGETLQILPAPDWPRLRQIYHNHGNRLLWHDPSGRIASAGGALQRFIRDSARLGVEPRNYHAQHLDDPQLPQVQQVVRNDLLLTDGFLRLSRHLAQGQLDPGSVDPQWKIPVEQLDSAQLLDRAVINLDPVPALESLSPRSRSYRRLLQALAEYRRIADRGGWPALPAAPLLHPGAQHELIPRLRQRLIASGDHGDGVPDNPDLYDPPLQQSVERFQQSHGLKRDGIVGPNTRAALNISVEQRIAQIASNLERWRWLPQHLGERYILVNIGGYLLQLVDRDEVQMEKRTIIGQPKRNTPSFTTRVTHLVANPTWTVPRRIAVEDLLPEQRRDSEYLLRKNIRILQREGEQWVDQDPAMIDWGEYNKYNFPFQLRQSPGDGNSLGRIKFHMPNPYAIYLHDTPARGLFEQPVRDFSSGCVRVQDIGELVDQLLTDSDLERTVSFYDQLESRESGYIRLAEPIDVFLVYFTAWVDTSGEVQFRPDIYNLDRPLILSLRQQYPPEESRLAHQQAENIPLTD
jgi:murein L,D-transpeptidase YcbB/YkuD